jgi:hypothetical protein
MKSLKTNMFKKGKQQMNALFTRPTIFSAEAAEDLRNNDLYIIDPETRKVRKPITCDEWFKCQLVYVLNVTTVSCTNCPELEDDNFVIYAGQQCRCWNAHITV